MRIANPQRWDVTPVEAEALTRILLQGKEEHSLAPNAAHNYKYTCKRDEYQ